jgi:two-component system, OmpR family, response regulator MprA
MSSADTILIVDDDPTVRQAFAIALTRAGYAVRECEDGIEALEQVQAAEPSLIILDVDMPGLDGWKTLAKLRQRGCVRPILMITHVHDVDSRVQGLESGADDYLGKPCSASEVVARVRALLRRAPLRRSRQTRLRLGNVSVDLEKKVASQGNETARLTRTECALLDILVRRPGVPVSREDIFRHVWGAKPGQSHTLDTHIWRLRRKLGDTGENPRWLLNHPGQGFALAEEVVAEGVGP